MPRKKTIKVEEKVQEKAQVSLPSSEASVKPVTEQVSGSSSPKPKA